MSYYILPKNINSFNVEPTSSLEPCIQTISFSYFYYYTNVQKQLKDIFNNNSDLNEEAIKFINPYEFIYSTVPGSTFSVSKLKTTNLFYDLFEIYSNLTFFDNINKQPMKTFHISNNYLDSMECLEMFREDCNDENISKNEFNIDDLTSSNNDFDFMYLESDITDQQKYFLFIVKATLCVLKNQNYNGNFIIKIGDIVHKPILDFIYLFTSLYEKVYIVKPFTNNIITTEKYLVCKSFKYDKNSTQYLKHNYLKLMVFLKKLDNNFIANILNIDIPCFFKNKIDDMNIVIGQHQLESLNTIVSVLKNKNKNDKIENMNKSNIQKSVSWCEKYKIPYNKFTEKINIFLPIINDDIAYEDQQQPAFGSSCKKSLGFGL